MVEFEILVICDFSENYENKNQDETQNAYFGHSSFSLYTACCYLRLRNPGELLNQNFVIVTEGKHGVLHTRALKGSSMR